MHNRPLDLSTLEGFSTSHLAQTLRKYTTGQIPISGVTDRKIAAELLRRMSLPFTDESVDGWVSAQRLEAAFVFVVLAEYAAWLEVRNG